MKDIIEFANREEFRNWLFENCLSKDGVWLLFRKSGDPKTIKASEALEEALCFGWIDGQMQSIDDKTYKKYFSMRRDKSKWSKKNKALTKSLEERGLMLNDPPKMVYRSTYRFSVFISTCSCIWVKGKYLLLLFKSNNRTIKFI